VLSRHNRLRSARDIARVYRQGSYGAGGGSFSVKTLRSGRPQARIVVVVGKKVDKRAVVRNRLRRRLVEAVQSHLATVRPGYDIVITVHSNFHDLSATNLNARLLQALDRAQVLNKS
jgi:ribonuclease P protein component